jgi:hypothetical protein
VRILVGLAGAAASAVAINRLYRRYLRKWVLPWGATAEEATRTLPGDDLLDAADIVATRAIDPERTLSTRSEAGDWVWTFVLVPENGSTRLLSRNRIAIKGAAAGQRLGMLVMEPGSLVMERKMLLGIKERAERAFRRR